MHLAGLRPGKPVPAQRAAADSTSNLDSQARWVAATLLIFCKRSLLEMHQFTTMVSCARSDAQAFAASFSCLLLLVLCLLLALTLAQMLAAASAMHSKEQDVRGLY